MKRKFDLTVTSGVENSNLYSRENYYPSFFLPSTSEKENDTSSIYTFWNTP